MSYLYNKNVNVQNNNVAVTTTNPFPVTSVISAVNGSVKLDLGATGTSAFGELSTISITPIVQLDAIYGLNDFNFLTSAVGAGASANTDLYSNLFKVQSGTSANGDAVLLSRKFMKYRPGQGALARFTAAFTTGVANSTQQAGFTDTENALCVGYDGDSFGVVRGTGGKVSIYKLSITTAPTGTQTATITLDGIAFTVTLASGTAIIAAHEISDRVGGYSGWQVEQIDNYVVFRNDDTKTTPGTFSFSSSGNAIGSFSVIQAGAAQTEFWTKQCDWNIDCLGAANTVTGLMGPNPSGMVLDHDKLNVYQIKFRWLGVGMIAFGIENDVTGEFMNFHEIHYTNKNVLPHILIPTFRIGYSATNKGNTANLTVTGASMMMGIEGIVNVTRATKAISSSAVSLAKDDVHHILSLRNSYTFAKKLNALSVSLKKLSFAIRSTDPVIVYILGDELPNASLIYATFPNGCATKSTTTTTFNIANIAPLAIFTVGINGENTISLEDLAISIPPGGVVSFAVSSTAVMSHAILAAIWTED